MQHGTPRRRILVHVAIALTSTTACGGRSPTVAADGICGDGVMDAIGEYCDGTDLGKLDCEALGLGTTGTLLCRADCTLDTSDCLRALNQCGDGEVGSTEDCDDGNSLDGDGCSTRCRLETGNCGDGIVQANEQCDPGISPEHCVDCRYDVTMGKVRPLLASAPDWNDWATTTEPPQRCLDPAQPTADAVCVHAGELRAVEVAGLTTCAGLFAQDSFLPGGAFEWRCEQTDNAIRFISTRLRPDCLLSDLLVVTEGSSRPTALNAFALAGTSSTELIAEPAFKSARLDITTPFGTIYGEESIWWGNPVEFFGQAESTPSEVWELSKTGTIYVLWPGHPNGAIRLGQGATPLSAVGIVVPRGITLVNSTVSPVLDLRQSTHLLSHFWLEGEFDAAGHPGLSADNLVYSVLRGLELRRASGHGMQLSAGQRNRFEGVVAEENAVTGLYLVREQHSSFKKLVTSANGAAGLGLFGSTDNEFADIVASGNDTDGIVLQVDASRNAFASVVLTDNGLAALRVHEDSCDNAFSVVRTALSAAALPNSDPGRVAAALTLETRADRNRIEALTVEGSHAQGISLRSNDNVLDDLTITHTSGDGIHVADCNGNHISHASISDSGKAGLNLESADENTLESIDVAKSTEHGVVLSDCTANRFSNVTIADSGKAGLNLESADENTFESIDVAKSTEHGVVLSDCSANGFSSVTIADSGKDGFSVLVSTRTSVTGLTVQRSGGGGLLDGGGSYGFYSRVQVEDSGADGIHVGGGGHATLTGFKVSQSVESGVELGGTGYVHATEGTIRNSGNQGLYLGGGHDHWVSTVTIDASGGSGLEVSGDERSHLDTIEITDSAGFGVSFGGVSDAQVTNIAVQGSRKAGVTLDGTHGTRITGIYSARNNWAGLALNGGEFNLLQNVTLTNNGSGITECSTKEGCSGGLVAFGTNNNVFAQVTSVANDGYGAVFVESSGNAILSWTVVDASADGVLLRPSSGSSDSGCQRNTLLGLVSANNGGAGLRLDDSPFNLVGDVALAHNGGDGLHLESGSLQNSFTGLLKVGNNAEQPCDTEMAGSEAGIDAACQAAVRPNLAPPQIQSDLDLRQSFIGSIQSDAGSGAGTNRSWSAANTIKDWSHFEHPLRAWVNGSEFARSDQRGRCVSQTCYIWDFSLRTTDTRLRAVLSKPEDGGANNVRTQYWYSRGEEDATASPGCAPLYPWNLREFHGKDSCSPGFWGLSPGGQCAGGRSICATQFLWPALEYFYFDDNVTSNGLCEDGNQCVIAQNLGSYLGHGEPSNIYEPSQMLLNGILTDVILGSYPIDGLDSISLYRYPSNGR